MARPRKPEPIKPTTTVLGDNVRRLLGLHALTAVKGAELLGISPQAMSELQWREQPRIATLERLSEFFEIEMSRLLRAPFSDLLANEVADLKRFNRVEKKLAKLRRSSSN